MSHRMGDESDAGGSLDSCAPTATNYASTAGDGQEHGDGTYASADKWHTKMRRWSDSDHVKTASTRNVPADKTRTPPPLPSLLTISNNTFC